ncbi:hypothetical protein HPB51_004039 [Rhipicephalus microplus]|uniref:Uncharacterized protein n=1 Tax=Rhipicephalus microplus TaxID=6941 RepID=A0A9J6EXF8_RHIMP|nr:hypothetical protein HPB51_004039 [Rhipicephalus microplus]
MVMLYSRTVTGSNMDIPPLRRIASMKRRRTASSQSDDDECGANRGGSDDCDDKEESPPNSKLKGGKRKRHSNGDAPGSSQPTLTALFSKMAKRVKSENGEQAVSKKPPAAEVSYTRCSDCRQVLDAAELRLFEGDPADAVDEFTALTDPAAERVQ